MLTVTHDGVMIYQTYQGYGTNSTYERKYYNGTWYSWRTNYDSGNSSQFTSAIATAITANTAKTGITSGQASAITANTAKTGISTSQASAITANTAKVTNSTEREWI